MSKQDSRKRTVTISWEEYQELISIKEAVETGEVIPYTRRRYSTSPFGTYEVDTTRNIYFIEKATLEEEIKDRLKILHILESRLHNFIENCKGRWISRRKLHKLFFHDDKNYWL